MSRTELAVFSAVEVDVGASGGAEADPITTEVIRHSLNSVAEQMKRALVRTAFSPLVYEMLDFSVAIYDRHVRLLAQAPSLPLFMGTLSFCVEGAVVGCGGEDALEPGDVIAYNIPYGTGAHPQDVAMVMPIFIEAELFGYAVAKVHWLDIAGKDPYCTDTIDVFQEGLLLPGVKLYSRGSRSRDIHNLLLANSRLPTVLDGDAMAQVTALRVGARGVADLAERYDLATLRGSIERIFDHGEAMVRSYFEQLPDGLYTAAGQVDDNGLDDEPLPFEVVVEVSGSDVRLDFTGCPEQQAGPMNTPMPSTVCAGRLAVALLSGTGDFPNEGHFRALSVITRPGSMFHPLPPAPCFMYGWPVHHAIEVILEAVGNAISSAVPAGSGGDSAVLVWWGTRDGSGEFWGDAVMHPVGQGGHAQGDGAVSFAHAVAAGRLTPIEVLEARNPWITERFELAPDSGGAGRHRGGSGVDVVYRMLEDAWLTTSLEHRKVPPKGLAGGAPGRANAQFIRDVDGTRREIGKATRLLLPEGAALEMSTGGGGGYGSPGERAPEAVRADLHAGYITEDFARRHYGAESL
ncbi:MAG TPA: hydantoinase B/oxoprolinase family protein [Baekduia sp.]|nr:hydantoinase B/oxoprolinase family protein [Baekduia sp.]